MRPLPFRMSMFQKNSVGYRTPMNEGGKSIIGALLAIAILGAVVVGAVTIFGKDSGASAKSDVTIQACQADPAGGTAGFLISAFEMWR